MSISALNMTPGVQAPSPIQGAGAAQRATSPVPPGGFADMLGQMITDAAGTVRNAEAASIAGIRGQMPAQQVVQTVLAAQETLQTAIAVRDKVVSAYLEISRMGI